MAKKKDSGSASSLIEIGRTAPAITLTDQHGQCRRLSGHRGQWVVLYFYPKDNTSGCTSQACQFRDDLPRFGALDAIVLGVSPDDATSHTTFIHDHDLNFDLLADTQQQVCQKYGVWQPKSMYGRTYMGVIRTTYLIDPKGRVAHRWDKVKVTGHAQEVLDKLAAFGGESG